MGAFHVDVPIGVGAQNVTAIDFVSFLLPARPALC